MSKPVPGSRRAVITMSIARAVPGNTSRTLQNSIQGALSSAQPLLALVASAVLFGYLSMRLLISRMAKVILLIFQIMETAR